MRFYLPEKSIHILYRWRENTNQERIPGTYFIPQLELWVRSSDNVVIDAPNGKGIGLTVTEWIATYGPGSTNSTNHNNSTK